MDRSTDVQLCMSLITKAFEQRPLLKEQCYFFAVCT